LRLGYAVVPHALLPVFLRARYLMDRQPPSLQQAVVAEFMQQGYFTAHIRRMRHAYCEQRDALVATLKRRAGDHLKIDMPDQGMHLVAYLANGLADTAIESDARAAGIVVHAISRFYRSRSTRAGLMLGFSGFPQALIVPAAARLGALITRRAAS
jgi:GntR family transcriptional regulator/MocR family aminotransferase